MFQSNRYISVLRKDITVEGKIIINPPKVLSQEGTTKVSYSIEEDGREKEIWFVFPSEFEHGLSIDCSDGILVQCLLYGIRSGKSIDVIGQISGRLLYQLEHHFIPAYANKGGFRRIHINCISGVKIGYATHNEDRGGTYRVAATGMSCGIDSLYTYLTHSKERENIEENRTVGLLTHFDVGAFHYGDGKRQYVEGDSLESRHLKKAKEFAEDVGLPLLDVKSNVAEIFPMDHDKAHTIRNCGVVLMFQNLIETYYYSSTFPLWNFKYDIDKDMAYYDPFTLQMLCTEKITFYSIDSNASRLEKTKLVAEYEISRHHLNVCTVSDKNCGKCQKCSRTMVELEAVGKLDMFKDVFPLENYNRNMGWGYALANKNNPFYIGIAGLAGRKRFSIRVNFYKFIFCILKPVERFMKGLSPASRKKLVSFAEKHQIRCPW